MANRSFQIENISQSSRNYSPWVSSFLPVFCEWSFTETQPHPFFDLSVKYLWHYVYGCFCTTAEWSGCNQDHRGPVFLPEEFHGQKSLAGYSSWGHRVGHNWATKTLQEKPAIPNIKNWSWIKGKKMAQLCLVKWEYSTKQFLRFFASLTTSCYSKGQVLTSLTNVMW